MKMIWIKMKPRLVDLKRPFLSTCQCSALSFSHLMPTSPTPRRSSKKNGEEMTSPRRSPRFQIEKIPRRSPRLQEAKVKVKRRSTPFPTKKVVFFPPPKVKKQKVRFSPNVDKKREQQWIQRSKLLQAAALTLGIGLTLLIVHKLLLK